MDAIKAKCPRSSLETLLIKVKFPKTEDRKVGRAAVLILLCKKCGSSDLDFTEEGKIVCKECEETMTRLECAIARVDEPPKKDSRIPSPG